MEALLIIGALVAGAHYIDKDEGKQQQLIDPNPAIREILYTGKGQYVHNMIVQEKSEVQWIISTN